MKIEKLTDYSSDKQPSKCPFSESEPVQLTNFTTGKKTKDTLHQLTKPIKCTEARCMGAMMAGQSFAPPLRPKEELLEEAQKLQEQYYASLKSSTEADFNKRMKEINDEVNRTGTYTLTTEEVNFAAKLAWRNAPRCIGRIQWNKLYINDYRHISSTQEMYGALCKHLEYATNGGNIRSVITVFPQRIADREDFRLWNPQLINFAGYLQPDGSVIGDPGRVLFTRVCQRLGWEGKGGKFDILPWVLSAPGEGAKYYDIPEELVLRVPIEHPKFEWFSELGIRWYAVPAVADMMLDAGGLCFTAAPFNGWYMATEIGVRNLCDPQRYNLTKELAEKMGLDTMSPISLWKDIVLVETTIAVLYSFQKNVVTLVDHHTAAETFMKHIETEQTLRGGCPADWVWIVPPISGSITPVFHQEMVNYNLKPSYEYQEKAWLTYNWPKTDKVKLKYSFANIAMVVSVCQNMMTEARGGRTQATILYASETGKSETFARKLANVLHASFNTEVICMDDYDCNNLISEDFVIVVASTFGSGEPPDNGKYFWKCLKEMKEKKISLENLRFAVFALGSSQYPHFCNFGKNVDKIFTDLGGKGILPVVLGDELGGQEHMFNQWLPPVYTVACTVFSIDVGEDTVIPTFVSDSWTKENFRLVVRNSKENSVISELSKLHNKKIFPGKVLERTNLQSIESERQTVLLRLDVQDSSVASYEPGDHVAVFPANPPAVVERILQKLESNDVRVDDVKQIECLRAGVWEPFKRLPPASLRSYLTYYLDITSPPTSSFLLLLSGLATDSFDKYRLKRLSEVPDDYEEWKSFRFPNMAEILDDFSSIQLDPTFLVSELPLLQPRYYSISSSKLATPKELHITFTLVSYRTQDNKGALHYGVCTSYLNGRTKDDIPCFIRSAPRFRLPEDPTAPVIMVGAGSGIAPFRSFWQERNAMVRKDSSFGPMYLFFGCRQSTMDNIYSDETSALVKKGVMTKVFTALSREPGQPKQYVQHKLAIESKVVLDVLAKNGHIYVCGDAVMAADVRSTIDDILSKANKKMDIEMLVENGQFHEDVFGVLRPK